MKFGTKCNVNFILPSLTARASVKHLDISIYSNSGIDKLHNICAIKKIVHTAGVVENHKRHLTLENCCKFRKRYWCNSAGKMGRR